MADQGAADRPHQESDREDAEGRQDLRDRVFPGKEGAADRGGEVAVNREVIPFEDVSYGAGGDDPGRITGNHSSSPATDWRLASRMWQPKSPASAKMCVSGPESSKRARTLFQGTSKLPGVDSAQWWFAALRDLRPGRNVKPRGPRPLQDRRRRPWPCSNTFATPSNGDGIAQADGTRHGLGRQHDGRRVGGHDPAPAVAAIGAGDLRGRAAARRGFRRLSHRRDLPLPASIPSSA